MTPAQERVFEYLKTHKFITGNDCRDELGTSECRKIISDLRKKLPFLGYKIDDVWVKGFNKCGEEVKFKRYFLKRI